MNNNAIGQFIQSTRKEKGLTQKQLAEQINVSDKTISKWENGFSTPDTTFLKLNLYHNMGLIFQLMNLFLERKFLQMIIQKMRRITLLVYCRKM